MLPTGIITMRYEVHPVAILGPAEEYQVRTSAADAIAARGITMASAAAAGWCWGNGSWFPMWFPKLV